MRYRWDERRFPKVRLAAKGRASDFGPIEADPLSATYFPADPEKFSAKRVSDPDPAHPFQLSPVSRRRPSAASFAVSCDAFPPWIQGLEACHALFTRLLLPSMIISRA